jgi:putative membrane protein
MENLMVEEPRKITSEEYRLFLQLETSLLAWLRTSLSLMGLGFVIARFGLFLREVAALGQLHVHTHNWLPVANTFTGTSLIVLGIVVMLINVHNHQKAVDSLVRGELAMPSRWSLSVILSLILTGLGLGVAIYLALV